MLRIYSLGQREDWDKIVKSFSNYDIYWLSGYVEAFKLHGDGEPLLFFCEEEEVRGIHVVMKRDVADDPHFAGKLEKRKYFDFSTPYGYGGWLIEGEKTEGLFRDYARWCQESGMISEFVRFHPMIKNMEPCEEFYDVVELGEVVHMELTSPEIIWENIVGKNRNMIRKAKKSGVKIYNGRYPEIYEIFQAIYNRTMDKDKAADYYYFGKKFYESILEDIPWNAQVFYAVKEGTVVSAAIMLTANGRMNYHLSGSIQEYSSFAPTNLLLYEAALWGYANGYKTLYLGGGVGARKDGLFKFKRSFYKGELNKFYIGRKIYDSETYAMLSHKRFGEMAGAGYGEFFPKYREDK